jgi:hypothetical protein
LIRSIALHQVFLDAAQMSKAKTLHSAQEQSCSASFGISAQCGLVIVLD